MGAVEDAVDVAANFIGPFVDKDRKYSAEVNTSELVTQALSHLQAINTADLAADPNAPYDASLAGVVYGLLDLITMLAIIPRLSSGVAFSQRPRSVLTAVIFTPPTGDLDLLVKVIDGILPILEQKGLGVQPLLSQRVLPDVVSALAELSFSPASNEEMTSKFENVYRKTIAEMPTSRLLPILTTFLQQPLPIWFKPVISMELSLIPLRPQGVRHTIEFLSLSYLTKNSYVPKDASGAQCQIPIPLEAVSQASKLLVLPPSSINQDEWLRKLAPQLSGLLDGNEGKELSRAAGQIIAGGILSKKTTGAPGTVGWEVFALPLLQAIYPKNIKSSNPQKNEDDRVIVQEQDLKQALKRLSAIASSYSHAGLLKRLIGPILLPLWTLINYAHPKTRSSLNKEWWMLPTSLLSRYMSLACDVKHIDRIATNLFWDGDATWTFGPGSQGGVEIRRRSSKNEGMGAMDSIFEHIGGMDSRVNLLVSLLSEAKIPDDIAAEVFLLATRRWLAPSKEKKMTLMDESEVDPLATLMAAKLSEALAQYFQEHLTRSPQHIIELMSQLVQNFVTEHKTKVGKFAKSSTPSRAMLGSILQKTNNTGEEGEEDKVDEDLVSFALSILCTLLASPDLKKTAGTTEMLHALLPALAYLRQPHPDHLSIPSALHDSAITLLHFLTPLSTKAQTNTPTIDPLAKHRATLKTALTDLTSPDPPNRTWALNTLRTLIQNPDAFPVLEIPSLTHMILSASLADPESYVHTAAIPVLVDLAARAAHPVVGILADAFIDMDERSLKPARGKEMDEKERELQDALDFRLRLGEVLNVFVLDGGFWSYHSATAMQSQCVKQIISACLSLASRRGQRTQTLSTRTALLASEQKEKEEGEAAWGGPIPNLLNPSSSSFASAAEQTEYDALAKVVGGWENTGIEEDIRIRTSALSVLGTVLEHRLEVLRQAMVDAGLQIVLLILTFETSPTAAILRRAGVLVIMGLLRGVDAALENGEESAVGLNLKQQDEVERVVKWVRDEDGDELVRGHAASVVEGLETLRMKKLYRVRDEGVRLGRDLGLDGNLRGLDVQLPANVEGHGEKKRMVIEEIE
ncbi:hypothetical protein EJ02DRAFT_504837 [Clathrospora elynae]|uniref:RNA polymerase II assembly factor Rtp1 C-terminal domain-containing protein n=1 Tax=Clathrospora elynae TaxID=706981 RepID=A0A6A5SQG4_9PLEO|nr:hypothetical protein EJ02DRAFT_504837 [Clathrospora elynae]